MSKNAAKLISKCIYCGSKNASINEHILPYALGGQSTLLKASCFRCGEITSQIIQKVAHGSNSLLGIARSILGMPTRRRGKRIKYLKQEIMDLNSRKKTTFKKDIQEYVDSVFLPIFGLPKLVEGKLDKKELQSEEAYIVRGDMTKMIKGKMYLYKKKITNEDFAKFIALIAYTHAVNEFGLKKIWMSPLRTIILGKDNNLGTYIGTAPDFVMFQKGKFVSIAYKSIKGHLIFRIKFFAWIKDSPEYVAIVT
jgi:hypothetical protein